MIYNTHTLSNGLRIIHTSSPTNVAYCGFAINAGTRDEHENELGMAHFVEHLIFKGTEKRKVLQILNRMENVGGDLNAYTNKEETVIYSAFLTEDFPRALELLSDIVFHSVFPEEEIEKEVEVIMNEMQSYEDSPSELIFDEFENMIFKNHPLGRNILGDMDQLREFGSKDARKFVARYYKPNNMVLFVQGNIDFQKITKLAEKLLGDIPSSAVKNLRTAPTGYIPEDRAIKKPYCQSYAIIGGRGYNAYDEKRTGFYLLNNILGGPGMNSRLNISLREKKGLVYNIESSLTSYVDTGAFSIYFETDHENVSPCLRLAFKELKNLRDNKLTSSQLQAAKKQLIGQIGVAGDNFETMALDMGKIFLHYNKFESPEQVFKRIEALTAEHLLEIANEMFDEERLSILEYTFDTN